MRRYLAQISRPVIGLRKFGQLTAQVPAMLRDCRASVAIVYAVAMPFVLGAAGVAVDYSNLINKKWELQKAADASALAAAKGLHIVNTDPGTLVSIAKSVVIANLGKGGADVAIKTSVSQRPTTVTVTLNKKVEHYIMQMFSSPFTMVAASATAKVIGSTPICVLGLDPNAYGAIALQENARMTGVRCAVYSNSTNKNGIKSRDSAVLKAELICSAGGSEGRHVNFTPEPLSDCPVLEDPLKDRVPPRVGACDHKDLVIDDTTTTLSPGVYCGGLKITDESRVKLLPGTYIIKDGQLRVDEESDLSGEHVGFYFTGKKATFHFSRYSYISLTAPKTGTMAGLLMFEDRNSTQNRKFEIYSDFARMLLGTIYLPRGRIYIDATKPIADQSAYTAIVARRLELYAGPHLVLNADYDATDIPVPEGIGTSRSVVLTK